MLKYDRTWMRIREFCNDRLSDGKDYMESAKKDITAI